MKDKLSHTPHTRVREEVLAKPHLPIHRVLNGKGIFQINIETPILNMDRVHYEYYSLYEVTFGYLRLDRTIQGSQTTAAFSLNKSPTSFPTR